MPAAAQPPSMSTPVETHVEEAHIEPPSVTTDEHSDRALTHMDRGAVEALPTGGAAHTGHAADANPSRSSHWDAPVSATSRGGVESTGASVPPVPDGRSESGARSEDGPPTAEISADQLSSDLGEEPPPEAVAVARALDERLTIWRRPDGRRVYVHHCRQGRVDCRERVVAIAAVFARSGRAHGVDPFLLAAVAMRESGLNPFAEGGVGERGIVQLHPLGAGSRVRFVRSDAHRRRCARRPDACQDEVLDAGANLLSRALRRCGSVAEALGAYNTGVCQETSYSRRVLEERQRLLQLAKGFEPASQERGRGDHGLVD